MFWYIQVACGWMGVQQNKETNEEHDKDCVEERFHLARMKFERDG